MAQPGFPMANDLRSNTLLRRGMVLLTHSALWAGGYVGAFLLRFDGSVPADQRKNFWLGLAVIIPLRVAIFWWSGLFHGLMRYAGIPEVWAIVRATTVGTILFVGAGVVIRPMLEPRSVYLAEWLLAMATAAGLRLAVRVVRETGRQAPADAQPVLLLGAGDAGELLLRDLERNPRANFRVVGILDDDPTKQGSIVRTIPVLGTISEVNLRRATIDSSAAAVVLAMPSASGTRIREIVALCREIGLDVKTLPSMQQIVGGDVRVSMLREVAIEDLLRREPVRLDERSLVGLLKGRCVLVTGGAGSIGSELARQAAQFAPSQLLLLDHNENGLFFLERELRAAHPNLVLKTVVADIKDVQRIRDIFQLARPHVVLHAAAHKHVPLMEANPGEAIKNNVFGTRIVAELANAFGTDVFVLISTDKAVNPTSVMGASKRVAEMCIQQLSEGARTKFAAVRFGNVLGSAGSVVQVFREQIAAGGPVTVTHPEMRRFFMTIPEASQLVLQAAALAEGGEIFVLDMGQPVKIVDLARDMIRMSGLEPDVDVQIQFSGQRPGEKLYEELFHSREDQIETRHPKIFVGRITRVDAMELEGGLAELRTAIESGPLAVRTGLRRLVPEATLEGLAAVPDTGPTVARLMEMDTIGLRGHPV